MSEKLKIKKRKNATFNVPLFLKRKPFITRITVINNKLFLLQTITLLTRKLTDTYLLISFLQNE